MEVAGLVIGIAGLFSVCTEVLDKFHAYRESDKISRQLIVRFEADRHRLHEWAHIVGFRDGTLSQQHHARLDDLAVRSIVHQILCVIIDSFGQAKENNNALEGIELVHREKLSKHDNTTALQHVTSATQALTLGTTVDRSKLSRISKIKWTFGDDKRFQQQVETLEFLTNKLYDLVPPQASIAPQEDAVNPQLNLTAGNFQLFADFHRDLQILQENNRRVIATEERRAIEDLLKPSSPIIDEYETNAARWLDGTCQWIFSLPAFQEWIGNEASATTSARFLWLCASAGSGKSVLSAQIVSWLKKKPDIHCFQFFCSSHAQSGSPLNEIISFWLCQMIKIDQESLNIVGQVVLASTMVKISSQTLWKIFGDVATHLKNCVFVIDGLDEYDKSKISRQGFLALLKDALASSNSKVLITSRDEIDIRAELVPETTPPGISLKHHKITKSNTEADINLFSKSVVKQRLSKKDDEFQEELAASLADRSDGMFLWITLSGQCLRGGLSKQRILQSIVRVPDGLPSAYHRTWQIILGQPEYERSRAIQIFRWCVFGLRPLTVGELTEALVIDMTDSETFDMLDLPDVIDQEFVNEEIVDLCNSLVEVRPSGQEQELAGQIVQLVHFSVKDFIISVLPSVSHGALKLESEHHLELAKICLHYLNSISEVESINELDDYKFMTYAVQNWHTHRFNAGSYDDKLCEMALTFLVDQRTQFSAWQLAFEKDSPEDPDDGEASNEKNDTALYNAAALDLPPTIEKILELDNVNLDAAGGKLGTPLQVTCVYGHMESFKLLIKKGADVNVVGGASGSVLHAAVNYGRLLMVQDILERHQDINSINGKGETPLNRACIHGHDGLVKLLLKHGANPNLWGDTGSVNRIPMIAAAVCGSVSTIKILLGAGVDLTVSDDSGETALHRVVSEGHIKAVELLLSSGASPLTLDKQHWSPLASSASRGDEKIVKMLLKSGADFAIVNDEGATPLFLAAKHGHESIVRVLVDAGADCTTLDNEERTPLLVAILSGNTVTVRFLLEHGASPLNPDKLGRTPLGYAASTGNTDILRLLFEFGAQSGIEHKNSVDVTPLHQACLRGNLDAVRVLLDLGANADATETEGFRPIHAAAARGHSAVVQLLLEHDPNLATVQANSGATPLFSAASNGNLDIVKMLLEKTPQLLDMTASGSTPLHNATVGGHTEVAELLIHQGANIAHTLAEGCSILDGAVMKGDIAVVKLLLSQSQNDKSIIQHKHCAGLTALHTACIENRLEIAELLLDNGAEIDNLTDLNYTPLLLAVGHGHPRVVQMLLDRGADMQPSKDIETPLYYGSYFGHQKVVEVLLSHGAEVNGLNYEGWAPAHGACMQNQLEVLKVLLQHGSQVDILASNKETPLSRASFRGSLDCAEYLLDQGADIDVRDDQLLTPLCLASDRGHLEIVQLLLKRRANAQLASERGHVPTYMAAHAGHLEVLKILVQHSNDSDFVSQPYGLTPLIATAVNGHLECCQYLLGQKVSINHVCNEGNTAFDYALSFGHQHVAVYLLENGADIDRINTDGRNALHNAARYGCHQVLPLLLNKGAGSVSSEAGEGPGTSASGRKFIHSVDELDNYGYTALWLAASGGHPEAAKELIENAASLDIQSKTGQTALFVAARNGHSDVVKLLLENGAAAAIKGDMDFTGLDMACYNGHLDIVRMLLAHGVSCKTSASDGSSALHSAAREGHTEVVSLLLASGAEIDLQDTGGQTAFWLACKRGHLETAKLLMTHGANTVIPTNRGSTPIAAAMANNCYDIVYFLLDAGVDYCVPDDQGRSLLHWAAKDEDLETLQKIVDLLDGKDHERSLVTMTMLDWEGRSLLHYAVSRGHIAMAEYLCGKELDFATCNALERGRSLLDYACISNNKEMVSWVLDRMESTNAQQSGMPQRSSPWTPLHWACRRGDLELVKLLISKGQRFSIVISKYPAASWTPTDIARYFSNSNFEGVSEQEWREVLNESIPYDHLNKHNGDSPPLLANDYAAQEPNSPKEEDRFYDGTCSGCGLLIYGPRFRCEKCWNFNYCFMCMLDAQAGDYHNHTYVGYEK